jgi:Bacterial Ig-like domain (group 2)
MLNYRKRIFIALRKTGGIATTLPILLLIACGTPPMTVDNTPYLTSLVVTPQTSIIPLGQTVQFKATGMFNDGSSKNLTQSAVWTTDNPDIAGINSSGLVTSLSPGAANVAASSGTHRGSTRLTISKAALVSLAIGPPASSIALGNSLQLNATGTFTDKSTQDVTSLVTWASSQPDVAVVSSSGLAVSRSVGAAAITAVLGAVNASNSLTVSSAGLVSIAVSENRSSIPLGTTAQFTAKGLYTDGSTQDISNSANWTSSPLNILSISNSGLATGKTVGAATVSATLGGISGKGALTVSSAGLLSIAVSENRSSIPLGTTAQFTAKGLYTDGSTEDISNSANWTSSPLNILSISKSGLATGKTVGAATVSATSGGISGKGVLTVSEPVLTSISVVSTFQTMPLGVTQQLTATGAFTDGSSRDLTASAAWSSASADIVSISKGGLASANMLGNSTVSATSAAIGGSVALTVSSAALSSILISPAAPVMPLASSQQLVATGTYTDGSTHDVTQSATWDMDNPAIASISGTGFAVAQQIGTTNVKSSVGGVVGSTTLTVQPVAAIGYFTHPTTGSDGTIRVTNPGVTGQDLCAMVYVFDQDQQMAECCGCIISPNGLRTFSLSKDFIGNPLTGASPTAGSVMIVTADYGSNPSCNAASISPSGLAIAWATHLQSTTAGQFAITEEPLSFTPLVSTLSSALQAQCSFIQQLGGGQGICSCGTGD